MTDYKISELSKIQYNDPRNELYEVQNATSKRRLVCTKDFGQKTVEVLVGDGAFALRGGGAPAESGTTQAFATAYTNRASTTAMLASMHRSLTTSASANNRVQIAPVNGSNIFRAYTNGDIGGFLLWCRFGSTACSNAGARFFVGVTSATSAIAGTNDPDGTAFPNIFGIAKNAADTELQFIRKNGTGTANKTSLGISLASLDDAFLDFYIKCDRNGTMSYVLRNMQTNTIYSDSESTAGNLPADVGLKLIIWLSTGAQTVAQNIKFHAYKHVTFIGDI